MTTQFTNPLHLYRSLLRETTYLFDRHARSSIQKYIVESYRAKATGYGCRNAGPPTTNANRLPTLSERRQLARGRKFLSTLRHANQGYETPLANVIKLAYGRRGRKRRDLMSEIMATEAPVQLANTEALLLSTNLVSSGKPVRGRHDDWKPPPRFMALLQSQIQIQSMLLDSRKLRLRPDIPETNKKGQPMPISRVRNITKKWYARSADALYPYLGGKDWDELRARSEGQGLRVIPRRVLAMTPVFTTGEDANFALHAYLLQGPVKSRGWVQRRILGGPHRLSIRYLKRAYVRVALRHTPRAVSIREGKDVSLQWYDGQTKLPSAHAPASREQANLLFG